MNAREEGPRRWPAPRAILLAGLALAATLILAACQAEGPPQPPVPLAAVGADASAPVAQVSSDAPQGSGCVACHTSGSALKASAAPAAAAAKSAEQEGEG